MVLGLFLCGLTIALGLAVLAVSRSALHRQHYSAPPAPAASDLTVSLLKFPSCTGLGIDALTRLRIKDRPPHYMTNRRNVTWRVGHYEHPVCHGRRHGDPSPPASGRSSLKLVMLLVCDHKFASIIPAWADLVRIAGISGVVGNVDAGGGPCEIARSVGCECLDRPIWGSVHTENTSLAEHANFHKWGLKTARYLSVKVRFEYALRLMRR